MNFSFESAYPPRIPRNTASTETVRAIYRLFPKYFRYGKIPGSKISIKCWKVHVFGMTVGGYAMHDEEWEQQDHNQQYYSHIEKYLF